MSTLRYEHFSFTATPVIDRADWDGITWPPPRRPRTEEEMDRDRLGFYNFCRWLRRIR